MTSTSPRTAEPAKNAPNAGTADALGQWQAAQSKVGFTDFPCTPVRAVSRWQLTHQPIDSVSAWRTRSMFSTGP